MNNRGILPDSEKTRVIAVFMPPSDKQAVRRFLGICGHYRRFVRDLAKLSVPLTLLTKDAVKFESADEHFRSFSERKKRLHTAPILGHFDQLAETDKHGRQ